MNQITLTGYIIEDAKKVLINENGIEQPLVTFSFMDKGKPYTKSEPMFIDVHFMKEVCMTVYPYLKKGKEITVFGFLKSKNYKTQDGRQKQKYYICAEYISLAGQK